MKIRTNIALALLLALLAAPAAYSGPSANRPARVGAGDFVAPSLHNRERTDASDVVSRYLKSHVQQQDRFITENSASQNRLSSAAAGTSDVRSSSRSFDWIAALIGAAGTLTLITLAMAVLRRRTVWVGM